MTEDEITVKIQKMFPNCEKYKKCCVDSGMEETMEKVKQIWTLAVANKKIAIGVVVAIIIIINLVN